MKLKQLASNMTEITLSNGTRVLFSYETPVAAFKLEGFEQIPSGMRMSRFTTIRTDKKYSVTTSKHINKYLAYLDSNGLGDTSYISVDQSVLDDLVK